MNGHRGINTRRATAKRESEIMNPIKVAGFFSSGYQKVLAIWFISATAIFIPVELIVKAASDWEMAFLGMELSGKLIGVQEFLAKSMGLITALLTIGVYGVMGRMVQIPIGHRAVLLRAGTREPTPVLHEGRYWIPPFCKTISYDCRQVIHKIPSGEVLSLDSVPISYTMQVQTQIADPYLRSGLDDPTTSIVDHAANAVRVVLSKHSALSVATASESLCGEITERLKPIAATWGIEVVAVMASDVRLPPEIEKYAQIFRVVRDQHPDVPADFLLNAFQAKEGAIKKIVYENSTMSSVVTKISEMILGTRS